jgi:hypothetical protein
MKFFLGNLAESDLLEDLEESGYLMSSCVLRNMCYLSASISDCRLANETISLYSALVSETALHKPLIWPGVAKI